MDDAPHSPRSPDSTRSSARKRRSRRDTTTTTTTTTAITTHDAYVLAYPAPVFTDKTLLIKHLRPRRYLQLQRLSSSQHHQPFIDVLSLAPPTDPRRLVSVVKRCFARLGRAHERCLAFDMRDVLLVRTDEAPAPAAADRVLARHEELTGRRVLAVLRAGNRIVTEDGTAWTVAARPHGSFEFSSAVDDGAGRGVGKRTTTTTTTRVVRWVPARRHRSSTSLSIDRRAASVVLPTPTTARPQPDADQDVLFNFSIINPATRRHPVLATLSPAALNIKETYQEPVSPTGAPRPSHDVNPVIVVDDATRTLILATAVWLGLHRRWSPSYRAGGHV